MTVKACRSPTGSGQRGVLGEVGIDRREKGYRGCKPEHPSDAPRWKLEKGKRAAALLLLGADLDSRIREPHLRASQPVYFKRNTYTQIRISSFDLVDETRCRKRPLTPGSLPWRRHIKETKSPKRTIFLTSFGIHRGIQMVVGCIAWHRFRSAAAAAP